MEEGIDLLLTPLVLPKLLVALALVVVELCVDLVDYGFVVTDFFVQFADSEEKEKPFIRIYLTSAALHFKN